MNQRIRDLISEAKFAAEEALNKQISKNAELDAFAEKFAELIVRECADVLYDNELGGYQVNYVLKEHFGVEE
jgi:hypothetical protein